MLPQICYIRTIVLTFPSNKRTISVHSPCQHKTICYEILERWFVEQGCGDYQQSVEPSSSLVDTLGNEISGEGSLKDFLLLEWIVTLGIWHAADLCDGETIIHVPQSNYY